MNDPDVLEKALLDPASVFDQPEEVLVKHELSRDQKIRILERWKYDAILMQTASGENMTGGENDCLDRIMRCLEHLYRQERPPPH